MKLTGSKMLQNIFAGGSTDAEFTEQVRSALMRKDNNESNNNKGSEVCRAMGI
jgi:hypothetical protein